MLDRSLGEAVVRIHQDLQARFGRLCRVAVALYDATSDTLRTFAHSTDERTPISCYETRLAEVPSLARLAADGQPRVLHDLNVLEGSPSYHSRQLLAAGYRSSYTEPLYFNGGLVGFLFYNAREPRYFTDRVRQGLGCYSSLVAAMISLQLSSIRTLNGALATAREFSRHRDEETANHLHRMSGYSRLIARTLAPVLELDDERVEYLHRFSQLHDIGKIAIPDGILLKPGRLSAAEFEVMKTHVAKGVEMVEVMVSEFGFGQLHHVDMLRNIVGGHHERYDGTGYPRGLAGEAIPLEARIVAVADVFDALTSERPYKHAWPPGEAFAYLADQAGRQFDPRCVDAACRNADGFAEIQARYRDEPYF